VSASRRTAVITGASSGIGAATARDLAARGFDVVLGARRLDRLTGVAADCERHGVTARALPLDVTDPGSVERFTADITHVDVLINNAGGAKGMAPVAEADEE
jgi:NADP-dependent 3-hydroxy acid dehydrogenase YdfG